MYIGKFIQWSRDTHEITDDNYRKEFHSVPEALAFQYKHGQTTHDYMIDAVYDKEGKAINIWEHTDPKFDVDIPV